MNSSRMTAPQNQSTARIESLNGRVLVLFMLICMAALKIAIWGASKIILFQVYGSVRVAREHLEIVKIKPRLVVSNGDIVAQRGFEFFLIGQLIWLPLSVAVFLLVWRLLPKPYHDAMQQNTYSGWSVLVAIILFFTATLVPLKLILLIAPLAIAVIVLIARASTQAPRPY